METEPILVLLPIEDFTDTFLLIKNLPQRRVKYLAYNIKTRSIRPLFVYQITSKFMSLRKNFVYWFDSSKKFMFFRYVVCRQDRYDFLASNAEAYDQDNTMLVMGFDMVKKKLFCCCEFREENSAPI